MRRLPYPVLAIAVCILALACCGVLAGGVVLTVGTQGVTGFVAGILPLATDMATITPTVTARASVPTRTPSSTPNPAPTETPLAAETPTSNPALTDTPAPLPTEEAPTPTPIIIVVTATPAPKPPPTVLRAPTDTPSATEAVEASATLTSTYKYPAPVLLDPANNGRVGGSMAILKWEPVSTLPLADDEWYAIRFVYLRQGQPVYQGDDIKTIDWRVPERFFYQADGPALLYRWYVYVEKKNADGSATQVSPNSEEFVFQWE